MSNAIRLRHLARINPGTPAFDTLQDDDELTFLPMEAVWPGSRLDISQRRPKKAVSTGYTRFQNGDVLVPKITPTFEAGRAVLIQGLHGGVGAGTTELHVVRAGKDIDPRFLLYVVNTHNFLKLGEAEMYGVAGQQRVPDEFLRDLPVSLPSLEEQRRIADFLDAETARIDRLVELRNRTLALLTERMTNRLDAAVRGVAASGPKRLADYSPLGEVPLDWRQGRLRSVDCDVQTGPFGSQLHAEDYVDAAWPVVNPANITPAGLVADNQVTVSDKVRAHLERHILRAGDVVFGRRGELGRAGIVTEAQEGWVCGTGSLRVRFAKGAFHPGYLRRYLAIPAVRHYFQLQAIGSTMPNLNSSILLNMPLLLPSPSEQAEIAEKCAEIESLAAKHRLLVERQMQLFLERRQALITAAVTGQFDVSTASGRNVTEGVSA
ncbi:restriction endonuclease subunit S [Streptomyces radiopugnans]|jgi:type I restriction enzyme S subunit|uniref:Type I restriction enzyme, S subunit n=1 Tax=Streptomyces radiopugnans TaxID=403935 RepID=A0A1H9B9T8_9ACTN|nr:restriction endonuclease subunit S [Streptomyces radiopugnans]SEP85517.1 type I restriction enzyme, S subunit [Streptomyces radiopugnans]